VLAYFIGGSWDLTKRHMRDCPAVWEVITMPRLSRLAPPSRKDMDIQETVKAEREFYVRARHDHDKDVAIYIFEEW